MSDQITGMRPTPGVLGDLEAWIEFDPGQSPLSREMRWYVRGPGLVVQFVVSLGWVRPGRTLEGAYPKAWDLGYHSDRPRYSGQKPFDCDKLPGGECYYDGSVLQAEEVLRLLIEEGDEAVWSYLAGYFSHVLRERIADE